MLFLFSRFLMKLENVAKKKKKIDTCSIIFKFLLRFIDSRNYFSVRFQGSVTPRNQNLLVIWSLEQIEKKNTKKKKEKKIGANYYGKSCDCDIPFVCILPPGWSREQSIRGSMLPRNRTARVAVVSMSAITRYRWQDSRVNERRDRYSGAIEQPERH